MNFDLGTSALRRALAPRTYTLRCKVSEAGSPLKVHCVLNTKKEIALDFWAKPLLSQSYSYEVDDEVIVEIRSLCEAYVLGLASELAGTDTDQEFYVRLGKNILKGRKDGTTFEFTGDDGNFKLEHTALGTSVTTKGVLTLMGDFVNIGDARMPALNSMTVCPFQGMHTPPQTKTLL